MIHPDNYEAIGFSGCLGTVTSWKGHHRYDVLGSEQTDTDRGCRLEFDASKVIKTGNEIKPLNVSIFPLIAC